MVRLRKIERLAPLALMVTFSAGRFVQAQTAPPPTGGERGEQSPQPPQTKDDASEVILITGIRAGLKDALTAKRDADSIVDAISADDIGKFPDENIAESLQRIPGLSITRSFGEGQDVSIRGLGPGRNLTLLNGQAIASSTFYLEDAEFSRGFNFALLPSELVSSVTVYKSPEARIQEGGIGGTIILNTRKPLDEAKFATAAAPAAGYSDLSERFDLRAVALGSWKNKSENFGVLLSGIHQERTLRRDAIEVLFYDQSNIDVGGDGVLEGVDVFYPGLIGSALFRQRRVRSTGLATVQWEPIDELRFTATGLVSRLGGDNTNHNYLSLQFLAPLEGPNSVVKDAIIQDNTAVFLDLADGPTPEVELDSILRETALLTSSVDLLSEWRAGAWSLSNHTGFTRATGGRGDLLFTSFTANTAYTSDIRDGIGAAKYATDTTNPSTLRGFDNDKTFRDNIDGTQQQIYTQLDLERRLENRLFSSLQVGAQYRDQFQDRRRVEGRLSGAVAFDSLDDITHVQTPRDFLDGIAGPDGLTRYVYPDIESLSVGLPISAYDFADDPTFFFKIDEQIVAAYAQANLLSQIGTVLMRGNFGVRYVGTKTTSRARRDTETNTYGEVLPSLNLTFDVMEDVILRVASARVMNRPGFTQLSPAVDLNRTVFTGTGGNPKLEPMVANQADVSGEWYFAEASAVSLAFFYKDIQSFVGLQTNEEVHDGMTYRVTRPFNGTGGNIYGLEAAIQYPLTFLPGLFSGLGFVTNYTLADSQSAVEDPQTGAKLPVPGQSKHTFNLVTYFENGPIGVRLAYNYRAKFFEQIDRGGARFSDAFGQLDGNLSYNLLGNRLTLFAEGLNLTNETLVRFVGTRTRPFQHLTTGRRFFLGIRGHY